MCVHVMHVMHVMHLMHVMQDVSVYASNVCAGMLVVHKICIDICLVCTGCRYPTHRSGQIVFLFVYTHTTHHSRYRFWDGITHAEIYTPRYSAVIGVPLFLCVSPNGVLLPMRPCQLACLCCVNLSIFTSPNDKRPLFLWRRATADQPRQA